MELVDVVDSKSTAGDSVPVRVRSPAPRGRKVRFATTSFYACSKKVVIRPLPCSSVPTATRFAGLAVGGPPCGRLFYKHQGALIFLLLLSKPDPLRWAPVWCRSMGGYFSFLAETSVLTALYRINGICERQVPFVMGFVLCGPSTLRYFNGIAPASRKNGHILFIRIARGGWHGAK